jgi:pimeloyl-ACP methyl ester carboxylesterase
VRVRHNALELAVHELRDGPGRPLLLLHGLGEQTAKELPDWAEAWPGPVLGLDFTGHGDSGLPVGGGYSCEILMADADAALGAIGPSTVVGRGLGGYVGLLVAGARPSLVRGVAIADGPGLGGGGPVPPSTAVTMAPTGGPPDPYALLELSRDVRPPDYASAFARQVLQLSGLAEPIAVCARWRPPWLAAVAAETGVLEARLPEALEHFARQPG